MPEKPGRLLALVLLLGLVVTGSWLYRRWHPTVTVRTQHYLIRSSATVRQTREMGEVVETLYSAYTGLFPDFPKLHQPHPQLQLSLFKDRREFRLCNWGVGSAEAIYRRPVCYAYYPNVQANPYHWMLQQTARQLNQEVAQLKVPQWIDEGLAAYFSTSRIADRRLHPGEVDRNAYPIWWLDELDLSGDPAKDIADKEIIQLQAIVSGRGGPDPKRYANLYCLHWWSLSHFLLQFDGSRYRQGYFRVIRDGGSVESFEKNIGPLERVQAEWYRHLLEQKKSLKSAPAGRAARNEALNDPPPDPAIESHEEEPNPWP